MVLGYAPLLISVSGSSNSYDPSHLGTYGALSNGNVTFTGMGGAVTDASTYAIKGISSGKKYWEVRPIIGDSGYDWSFGIANVGINVNDFVGNDVHGWGLESNGTLHVKWHNGTPTTFGVAFVTGDTIGFALDMDNKFIYIAKNNTWMNSGDPTSGASGTGAMFGSLSGIIFPAVSALGLVNQVCTTDFALGNLIYTPPSGYTNF